MRIAAYCRVSTDKDEQLSSLCNQRDFFAEYARRNGHELVRLYADEGISGTSLKKREEFKKLLQDAEYGLFDLVVVKDVSRFARNTVDALQSIRKLKSMGINTQFLTANMDTMGDSEFILTLFSAMAQEESNNLSKRVKWGKKINAQKGRVPANTFGYDRIDNFQLAINPQEASVVRKIFALYAEQGLGCRSISMRLNQDGDKTKYGKNWDAGGVRRVLVNPLYCGILVNHKYEIEDFLTGKQISLPKDARFYHERPQWAIITRELFQKAQRLLEERRNQYSSGEPFQAGRYSAKHIFSTLIKCEHCGRSFTRKSYTYRNRRVYWRCITNDQYTAQTCENRVTVEEAELLAQLRMYFAACLEDREGFIQEVLAEMEDPKESPQDSERILKTRRSKLLFRKERYQELYANELITIEELKEKIADITRELGKADSALERFEQITKDSGDTENLLQIYRQEILRFLDLETITNMDMRRIIDYICVNKEGEIRVVLKRQEKGLCD